MRLALLVLLSVLSASVVASPVVRVARSLDERLDEEEDSGSWWTKILFWPEWLFQQLPLSDAAKETAHQAYLTLTNVPVIGWALIGRDSLRDTAKSADKWIFGDNTTTTTTDNSTMMSTPSNASTTTEERFDYDFNWKDADAEMALDYELEELKRLEEEEEEEKTITVSSLSSPLLRPSSPISTSTASRGPASSSSPAYLLLLLLLLV